MLSGSCTVWGGDLLELVAHGLGLSTLQCVDTTADVGGGRDWELCLQVGLRWNHRCGGHQSQGRGFVFRLCIPSFGGQVGEDSEFPTKVSRGEEALWCCDFGV